jgi:ferrous iron transport protein B
VTVEHKSGFYQWQDQTVEVIDLPGLYSSVMAENGSLDEQIACRMLLNNSADLILNIVDASNLERNLYLTLQLLEMNLPIVVVLNMMDMVRKKSVSIDLHTLAMVLNCPVIAIEAQKEVGLAELKVAIATYSPSASPASMLENIHAKHVGVIHSVVDKLPPAALTHFQGRENWLALRLLETDFYVKNVLQDVDNLASVEMIVATQLTNDIDIMIADNRYTKIQAIMNMCLMQPLYPPRSMSDRIDKVVY